MLSPKCRKPWATVPRGRRAGQDTWRDPRGFALKLYTSEGNLDIVGNRTPIFFMRDPLKSQHFIRSQKRRADTGLRDHDMQWDSSTLSPESAHQVTWLMGDRGIPKTWRHMNRYSSDTYSWINTASLDSAERQCIRSERHVAAAARSSSWFGSPRWCPRCRPSWATSRGSGLAGYGGGAGWRRHRGACGQTRARCGCVDLGCAY